MRTSSRLELKFWRSARISSSCTDFLGQSLDLSVTWDRVCYSQVCITIFFQHASLEIAGMRSAGISRFFMTAQPTTNSTSLQQAPTSRAGCAIWGHCHRPVSVTHVESHLYKPTGIKAHHVNSPQICIQQGQITQLRSPCCLSHHCSFWPPVTAGDCAWALPSCSIESLKQLYPYFPSLLP